MPSWSTTPNQRLPRGRQHVAFERAELFQRLARLGAEEHQGVGDRVPEVVTTLERCHRDVGRGRRFAGEVHHQVPPEPVPAAG